VRSFIMRHQRFAVALSGNAVKGIFRDSYDKELCRLVGTSCRSVRKLPPIRTTVAKQEAKHRKSTAPPGATLRHTVAKNANSKFTVGLCMEGSAVIHDDESEIAHTFATDSSHASRIGPESLRVDRSTELKLPLLSPALAVAAFGKMFSGCARLVLLTTQSPTSPSIIRASS